MNFIKALLTFVLFFTESQSHATNNYQDWWWNPAQSGMGLNVGQQNDTIFVAWFNYGEDTKANSSKSHWGYFDALNYTVEPDTSTSVLFNLLKRSTLDTNQVDSINQLRYRLNAAGELELISATVDSPLTKAHLVFQ